MGEALVDSASLSYLAMNEFRDIDWLVENAVTISALRDLEGAEKMLQVMRITRDDGGKCLTLTVNETALKDMSESDPGYVEKATRFLSDVDRHPDWPKTSALQRRLDDHSRALARIPPESRELQERAVITMKKIAALLEAVPEKDEFLNAAIQQLQQRSGRLWEKLPKPKR